MPRYIMKIGDRYGEWSTVVDAPVTALMTREEFAAYYQAEYGRSSMGREFEERMKRADAKGTSSMLDNSAESVMGLNRCGPNEEELPVEKVIELWQKDDEA